VRYLCFTLMGITACLAACSSSDTEIDTGTLKSEPTPVLTAEVPLSEVGDITYSEKYGQLYLAETFEHRITVLDENMEPVIRFGDSGRGPGDLNRPSRLKFHNDKLYVFEEGNNRISVFTQDGIFLKTSRITDTIRMMNFWVDGDSSVVYASNSGTKHLVVDDLDSEDNTLRFGMLSNESKTLKERIRHLGFIYRNDYGWLFISPFLLEAHFYDEEYNPVFRQDLEKLAFFDFLSEGETPSRNAIRVYLEEVKKWDGDIVASVWTLNEENQFRILKHLLRFSVERGSDALILKDIYDLSAGGNMFTSFLPVGNKIYAYEKSSGKLIVFEVEE